MDHPSPDVDPISPNEIIRWIFLALIAWGLIHGIGAYTLNYDFRRPLVVYACMGLFLLFWWVMLATRKRRLAREHDLKQDEF